MKCSSRSTAWCARTWGAAAAISVMAALPAGTLARVSSAQADDAPVRLAMIDAIRARVGESAIVRLENVRIEGDAPAGVGRVVATPEPGSRVGRPVRFALTIAPWPGAEPPRNRHAGRAVAEVFVAVEHVRATAAVAQGTVLAGSDLRESCEEVGVAPLAPLPALADVLGGRATRALRAGELVTAAAFRPLPLVRSGDTVRVHVRIGSVEAAGHAVAQQSGHLHERIRLVNPESRRALTGRVTGAGEVEVIHES